MSKLWKKNIELNKVIENYTVGNDYVLDKNIFVFDCLASIAHAKMLKKINILSSDELNKLKIELTNLIFLFDSNKFIINKEDEDCHTAIENYLVKTCGNAGKKIHTARSRNDQVMVATQLYSKSKLFLIEKKLLSLIETIILFAKKHEFMPMPGYTHMQKAMPSTIGLWSMSFAEQLFENICSLELAFKFNDSCPLGSAAAYGTNFEIDRELVKNLLGFEKIKNNALSVQNNKGKLESNIIFALNNIMQDFSKLAADLLLFTTEEFNFFKFPEDFYTGSSIMPQKKNLDFLELLRGKSNKFSSNLFEVLSISKNLPSGYNRDSQLIKGILFKSFEELKQNLDLVNLIFENIIPNNKILKNAISKEMFATDYVNELVKKGQPFREAYNSVSLQLEKLDLDSFNVAENLKSKKALGMTGNLGINPFLDKVKLKLHNMADKEKKFNAVLNELKH